MGKLITALILTGIVLPACGEKKVDMRKRAHIINSDKSPNAGEGDAQGQPAPAPTPPIEDIINEVKVAPDLLPKPGEATKEKCNELGLVYVALDKPVCGEPLAKFPCCPEAIIARFQKGKDKLEDVFKGSEGYELYNCGQVSTLRVKLHFLLEDGNGLTSYKTAVVKGKPQEPETEVSCPAK